MHGTRGHPVAKRRQRAVWAFACIFAALQLTASSVTCADEIDLSWVRGSGAASCPSAASVRKDIAARIGRYPFGNDATRTIEASLTRESGRWIARVVVRASSGASVGTRELESDARECGPLAAAATLVIALLIDPSAKLGPIGSASALPPAPTPPLAPAPSTLLVPASPPAADSISTIPFIAPTPNPPRERPTPPIQAAAGSTSLSPASVSGGALFTSGLVPKLAPGVAMSARVRVAPRLSASMSIWWVPESSRGEFAFGLTSVVLGACADLWRNDGAALHACVDALGGAVHASVRGMQSTEPGDRPWFGLSPAARFVQRVVGPFTLEVGLGAVVPFTRYRFTVEGRGDPAFVQFPVALVGSLAIGTRF